MNRDRTVRHLAFEFYSENHDQLDFDTAKERLESTGQLRLSVVAEAIDHQLCLKSHQTNVVGDTSRWGSENSIMDTIENASDYDVVRYSAARKGLLAHQDSVISFYVDGNGLDGLYCMRAQGVDPHIMRIWLDAAQLASRTLISMMQGTEIVIFEQGRKLKEKIRTFCKVHKVTLNEYYGRGEVINEDNYKAIINSFESHKDSC